MYGAINVLDDEGESGDEYAPDLASDSDEGDGSTHCPSGSKDDDDDSNHSTPEVGQASYESAAASDDPVEPGPRRSNRKSAPMLS